MKNLKLNISIIFLLVLISCDSTNSPNYSSQSARFMPLNIGNYWVYEYYDVDINQMKLGNTFIDSIVVDSKTTIEGKNAYLLKTFRNNSFLENSYIYAENNALYRLYDFKLDTLPKGFQKNIWQKISGFNLNPEGLWHIIDTSFNNCNFEWFGTIYTGKRYINLNGKYLDESKINLFGKERVVLYYTLFYDHSYSYFNVSYLHYYNKRIENLNYLENVGIYEWKLLPSSFELVQENKIIGVQFINGWNRKLLRYKLKD